MAVTIDPTVPETPPGSGIFWDSNGGTWVDTKHGNAPWDPTTNSWGAPQPLAPTIAPPAAQPAPSLPAQTAGANNTLTLSGATLNNAQAGAATSNAAANTANAATNAEQVRVQAARNEQLHAEALAAQGLTQQQITNSYNADVMKYGIDKATLLLNARQAAARSLIDSANFQLAQNAQNAQSRQTMASQQLEALKMLEARRGPQDYTQWDYMTGMGGASPKPIDSRTYSPLDMIAAQYQPSNIAAPAGFDASGIDVGSFPAAAGATPVQGTATTIPPAAGGGTSSVPPASSAPAQPGTAITPQGVVPASYGGTYNPQGNVVATNNGNGMFTFGNAPGEQPKLNSTPLPGYASGGTTGGAAVVGDAKSGKPTGHEEVAYASNNPQTGVAELHVIPHEMLAGLIDQATGRRGGMVMHANKVPKEMMGMLPRAAGGGVFGYASVGDPRTQATNGQVPSAPANAGSAGIDPTSGVPQYQPSPGAITPPQAGGGGITTQFDAGSQPVSAPGRMVNVSQPAPAVAITPPAQPGAGQSANLVGGMNVGGTAAPPPVSLGPQNYDPYRITVNKYSPDVMNNSPLLQMLRGQRPVYGFQGQGDYRPGIPSEGITDLPLGLNYGDWLHMDPVRQAMIKSMYDNPQTGESFDQILAMAKAAAPRVGNFGVARAR